jgi:hypothetical protein
MSSTSAHPIACATRAVYNDEMKDPASCIWADGRVPRAAVLDAWSDRDWSDGVHLYELSAMDRLMVTTRNSVYDIVVVSPRTGEVMVRGGIFFPSFTSAHFCGSSLGGSFLKLHVVHAGFCLELCHDDLGLIVTSPVQTVSVSSGADRHSCQAVM